MAIEASQVAMAMSRANPTIALCSTTAMLLAKHKLGFRADHTDSLGRPCENPKMELVGLEPKFTTMAIVP